jgi:protein O-GlcNAc transferase
MARMVIQQEIDRAVLLWRGGRPGEAMAVCRGILAQPINDPHVLSAIGGAVAHAGMIQAAAEFFSRASEVNPSVAEFHNNFGFCLDAMGLLDQAVAAFGRAIQLNPDYADAFYNLGIALQKKGKFADAVTAYSRTIALQPTHAEAFGNMGVALREQGRIDEAMEALHRGLQLKPDYAIALNNLGNIHWEAGRPEEAIAYCRRAIQVAPNYSSPYTNLGNALKEQGRMEEAQANYARAMELNPTEHVLFSNFLFAMHFQPRYDAAALLRAHVEWDRRFGLPLRSKMVRHSNDRNPDRRLRVGYVSGDLKGHPVGRFLLPLLQAHDRSRVEIFCYSDTALPDALTGEIKAQADVWREISLLNHEQAAEQIRRDQIDVLVDLAMHTSGRLPVFAIKPAPVQITYLAYVSTTGLSAMDYRLTDPCIDPPGVVDRDYAERSIRLPQTYFCYRPHVQTPEPGPLPALGTGVITFACLNNFCKVTDSAIKLWCEILRAVPGSQLLLHAKEGTHRQRIVDQLIAEGIDPARLSFLGQVPTGEYFQAHQRIDIALDPFPCNGGTTTCDAIWMGVPVITLVGRTGVGRMGKSILSNLGTPELIAETPGQYVRIATDLAGDLPRLAALRSSLRPRMQASPLMDVPTFARHIEAAYRWAWQQWGGN